MKTITKFLLGLLLAATAAAQTFTVSSNVLSATPINMLAQGAIIERVTFTATTATNTTVKMYDSSGTSTNIVKGAYSRIVSYATNYSVVFTNESDVIITNTYSGVYTGPVAVAASTNERTAFAQMLVPASSQRSSSMYYIATRGVLIDASNPGVVEVTYRINE
jgi:hypothetical protein